MSEAFRTEKDALGEVRVPSDRLWGAQTQRSIANFPIGVPRFRWDRPVIRAMGIVKLAAARANAKLAVDLFCYRIGRELGSLAAALGGLDALVFTGGIGEHAAPIRAAIVRGAAWLGLALDEDANAAGKRRITEDTSKVPAYVVPTDEELMIARHVRSALGV